MSCVGCNMCTLCLREKKKTKPTCHHFSESNSTVEWRVKTSTVQAARLVNGGTRRNEHCRVPDSFLPAGLVVLSGLRRREKTASTCTSLLCINWPWALCWLFPSLFPSSPSVHPTEKPWFHLNIQGHGTCDSEISRLSLLRPVPHLASTGTLLCFFTLAQPQTHNGNQATAHEHRFSYCGS